MHDLGVGLIWSPELAPLCEAEGVVDVVELEPQTTWEKVGDGPHQRYRPDREALARVAALSQPALLHGIGQPVGGVVTDPVPHLDLLRETVGVLDPCWVSEHLSFNRLRVDGRVREAGFLLPPRQDPAGVRVAAAAVRRYGAALGRPVAFETGVNYFRPRPGELPDGDFFAGVATAADSGILLDLHNLWCNERNGRITVEEVLTRLPLDRVWEVHLAGGDELDGTVLDAHRGGVDPELLDLATGVVERLPQVGALMFEVLPDHVAELGLDAVAAQLDALRRVWAHKPVRVVTVRVPRVGTTTASWADRIAVGAWEQAVVAAIDGHAVDPVFSPLTTDPGAAVYRRLISEFRLAAIARCLRHTTTALLLGLGRDAARALFDDCHTTGAADPFPAVEAERMARELLDRRAVWAHLPFVADVLAFEHALLRAVLFAEPASVAWTSAPDVVLAALAAGRWPAEVPAVETVVRVAV